MSGHPGGLCIPFFAFDLGYRRPQERGLETLDGVRWFLRRAAHVGGPIRAVGLAAPPPKTSPTLERPRHAVGRIDARRLPMTRTCPERARDPPSFDRRELRVLDVLTGLAPPGVRRLAVAVAEIAALADLSSGETSRALTRLWFLGRIRLIQAPTSVEPSIIDLLDDPHERPATGGKGEPTEGDEESAQNRSEQNRSDQDKNTKQTDRSVLTGQSVLQECIHISEQIRICSVRTDGHARANDETRESGADRVASGTAEPTVHGAGPTSPVSASRTRASTTADTRQEVDDPVALATECATALGAEDSLPVFLSLAREFGPDRLRAALATALAWPAGQVRKSRAALFTYLVKHGT